MLSLGWQSLPRRRPKLTRMLGLARLHKLHIESLFGRCWSWACRRFQTRKHDRRRHLPTCNKRPLLRLVVGWMWDGHGFKAISPEARYPQTSTMCLCAPMATCSKMCRGHPSIKNIIKGHELNGTTVTRPQPPSKSAGVERGMRWIGADLYKSRFQWPTLVTPKLRGCRQFFRQVRHQALMSFSPTHRCPCILAS
jgi:hypothetical protein